MLIQQNDLLISLTFLRFETGFFEWQHKKFKHNRLLEMEVIALSSELAAFIVSECLEKRNILHCTVREVQGAVRARAAR